MSGYWFKFRFFDFERSCDQVGMNEAERYAYVRILALWNDRGDGYSTEKELRNFAEISSHKFNKFFPKLSQLLSQKPDTNPVEFYHHATIMEISETAVLRQKRRKGGLARAAHAQAHAQENTQAHAQHMLSYARASPDSRQEDITAAASSSRIEAPEKEAGGGSVSHEKTASEAPIEPGPPDLTKLDTPPDQHAVQALVDSFLKMRQSLWPGSEEFGPAANRAQIEREAEAVLRLPGASVSAAKGALADIMASEVGRGHDRPQSLQAYHLSLPERMSRIVAKGENFISNGGDPADSAPPSAEELAEIKAQQLAKFVEAYGEEEGPTRDEAYEKALVDRNYDNQVRIYSALKRKLGISEGDTPW